jgi:glycosyltransferase involved in cell wall biosynthesis
MRVLQVADHFPPYEGGLGGQAQRIAQRLRERGHPVAVITVAASGSEAIESGIPIRRVRLTLDRLPHVYQEGSPPFHPPWPDPEFRRALTQLVTDFEPDVLHVHGWSVFSAASLTRTVPIVCTLHDYGLVCPKKSLLSHGRVCRTGRGIACVACDSDAQPTPRRVSLAGALSVMSRLPRRRVAAWMPVSQYVADRHVQGGLDPSRVVVVPPVIDAHRDDLRSPGQTEPYILYVGPGPEGAHKGRSVLLAAIDQLTDMDHKVVLVGGREPIAGARIDDRGYLRGDDLAAAFRDASFAVVPSIWPDPCPAVAVEAMGWGRPVVASATGGLPDIVEQGVTGLLVPPGDVEALATAIQRLSSDSALREGLGERARSSVGRFSTEAVLPQIEEMYQKALVGDSCAE